MQGRRGNKNGCCFTEKVKKRFRRKHCSSPVGPLSKRARTGRVKVCKITGDRKICGRMASMGLYPGVEADIICSETGNRCLLKINGGTISLDSDISENILVSGL